jgi:DNA-directed RNA polymerase specialized sigma24 family protein
MDADETDTTATQDNPAAGLRAALALHRLAERVEASHVVIARAHGWSWQQIGNALGVTRQSVHAKYARTRL